MSLGEILDLTAGVFYASGSERTTVPMPVLPDALLPAPSIWSYLRHDRNIAGFRKSLPPSPATAGTSCNA